MGTLVFTNAKILLAGYDLSADHNRLALDFGAEVKDVTTFGDTHRRFAAGLATLRANGHGFWEGGLDKVDEVLFGRVGLTDEVLTLFADAVVEGSLTEKGFAFLASVVRYAPGERVGEILAFDVEAEGKERLARAIALKNALATAVMVTGNGTAFNLGTVPSGQRLYGGLHVIEGLGTAPTLNVLIQSDDVSGFTTPTTRVTFGQKTGRAAEWATPVAGPITDIWWRASWTVGGTGPSFKFLVWLAIH